MLKEHQQADFFARHPELYLHPETLTALVNDAIISREKAYTPYSGYRVGAAVLTNSGKV